jgi:DNA-directed RNA polymerase subunit RPC12/RpoP
MDGQALMDEWARRQAQHKDKIKPYNRIALWLVIAAAAAMIAGPGDEKPIAICAILFAVVGAGFALFTQKYLRCPNCSLVPGFRSSAYGASACPHCGTRLAPDLLAPP